MSIKSALAEAERRVAEKRSAPPPAKDDGRQAMELEIVRLKSALSIAEARLEDERARRVRLEQDLERERKAHQAAPKTSVVEPVVIQSKPMKCVFDIQRGPDGLIARMTMTPQEEP